MLFPFYGFTKRLQEIAGKEAILLVDSSNH